GEESGPHHTGRDLMGQEAAELARLGAVRRCEPIDGYVIGAREKASEARLLRRPAAKLPQEGAELEVDEADLLFELASERLLVGFPELAATAGRDPPVAVLVSVAEKKDAAAFVDDRRADRLPFRQPALASCELAEPAQPLLPWHRRVRGRCGREDEQACLAER